MRVLKKILLWLLLVAVLAALIVGGAVAWFYYNTDPEAFDAPAVTAGGTALAVNGYEWNAPVMGGVLFKSASAPATLETQDLGTWEQASPDITLPADRPTHLVVKDASGNVLGSSEEHMWCMSIHEHLPLEFSFAIDDPSQIAEVVLIGDISYWVKGVDEEY